MEYFAGLDVSLEETAVCVVDGTGGIVREARVASEPEALVAFFGASGMEMARVGLEACSLTAWLQAGLSDAGIPAICIEARQAKAAMGAMPNKTDRNDARGIAQIMRTGWYRAVHVKSPPCRSWRALLTARRMLLNKRRDVENGIRALLREVGLKVGTPSRKDFGPRVCRATCVDGPRGSRWRRREAWGRFDCGHVSRFFVRSMTASPDGFREWHSKTINRH